MIDATHMEESELPNEESRFGTRSKVGTIADRQTRFLTFDRRVPIIAAVALAITLVGWIANAASLVNDVKANKTDIAQLKEFNKAVVQKDADRDQVAARIDERTKMTEDAVNRIEKYLISRGK
jgi:hypothetical protein